MDEFEKRRGIDIIKTRNALKNNFKIIRIDYTQCKKELIKEHIINALNFDGSIYLSDNTYYNWLL